MLEKTAHKLTHRPKLVIMVAVLLLIPSIIGAACTRINYDILTYLPQDLSSTQGLEQTGVIQSAKDTVSDLIADQWDSHSGQVDGLLNMDAGAIPVSMTESRNEAPRSVQYVMRTQEIQEKEVEEESIQQEEQTKTTFWGRIAAMFRDLWGGFTGLFRHSED